MIEEIFLGILQAITEFLPISSSGHLALFSSYFSEPNLFLFSVLHFASLVAVLIFTRKELFKMIKMDKKYSHWWFYVFIATIPAVLFGLIFQNAIESTFFNVRFLGFAFIFTGGLLLSTKIANPEKNLKLKNSFLIGLLQTFALFPGVSRSGMTISTGLLADVKKEEAVKFSFILFIPLVFGALILELGKFYIDFALVISFFVCLFMSLFSLKALQFIVKKDYFWMFSFYCFALGIFVLFF